MSYQGRVVSINSRECSGLIRDIKGNEFIFTQWECKDDKMPLPGDQVTFIKDEDWRTINVALMVATTGLLPNNLANE